MSLGEGKIRLVGASTSTITVGAANSIKLSDDGTDRFLVVGSKTSFTHFDQSTAGLILGTDNGTTKFELAADANNYISFNGSAFDIKTQVFTLDTTNLDINSATKRIEVSDGSNVRVRIGEVDSTSANHFGITIYDGTGTAASDEIVHLSDAKNQIASWSLSPNQISSNNLILDSDGIIQTSDFASGVKGWRITSANNGEAEFEKVTVRGTLSTTVFEKETVNAVGGQLYVANSTIYTGSAALSSTATTMSVANVGGFTGSYEGNGEIISVKKISDTGFATEYMLIQSASRDTPSSNTDLRGKLFVVRGYSGSTPTTSGSLGDSASSAQTYENGQVIVSTGRIGTGFIRLNANPNDVTTPYIDIVERTGSAIYDIELKARLGDLSGLSSGLLFGNASPGFGLFTENVFLKGAITATTGSIEGILHVRTDLSNQVTIGTNVKNTLDGIHINDNNFWYTNGHFRTGFDSDNFIHQSGSALTIKSETFDLNATTLIIDSANNDGSIRLCGSGGPNSPTANTAGIYMDGGGAINVFGNTTNLFRMDGAGSLTMKSDTFNLETSTIKIDSTSNEGKISLGATAPTTISGSDKGIYLDGKGNFRAGNPVGGRIEFDGSEIFVSSSAIFLGSTGSAYISASNGNMQISSSKFYIQSDGDIIVRKVNATEGTIGGFSIDSNEIKTANNELRLKKSGELTASNYLFNGSGVITGSVTIGTSATILGTLSAGSIATPSSGPPFKSEINSEGFARFVSASIGGFEISSTQINSIGDNIVLKKDGEATISGSSVNIETPAFFLGATGSSYISGSGGNLQITSSNFHLTPQGNITASNLLLGDKAGSNFLQFVDDTLTVRGDLAVDSLFLPATIAGATSNVTNASSSLDSNGFAKFVSASIGGFEVNSSQIKSTNDKLILKANGQITASAISMSGAVVATSGEIGGFRIGTDLTSTNGTLQLKGASGQITASAVSMSGMINAGSGQIGNFAITSNNLVGGTTFKLDPTTNGGELMLGAGFGPEAIDGTDAGLYVNGGGGFNLVVDGNNRIHNDGGLFILSQKFDLDAGTIIMDSQTNSGKLAIGGTPPTAYNSGVGIILMVQVKL